MNLQVIGLYTARVPTRLHEAVVSYSHSYHSSPESLIFFYNDFFRKNKSCRYGMKPLALLSTFFKICLIEFTWRNLCDFKQRFKAQCAIKNTHYLNTTNSSTWLPYGILHKNTLQNDFKIVMKKMHFKEDVIIFWGVFLIIYYLDQNTTCCSYDRFFSIRKV